MSFFKNGIHIQERLVFTGVLFWFAFVLVSVIFYVLFGASLGMAVGSALCAIGITSIFLFYYRGSDSIHISLSIGQYSFFSIMGIILDVILLVLLIRMRIDMPLQTPWIDYGIWIFIGYACATAMLFFSAQKNSILFWIQFLFHGFITYGVSLVVFQYGFGYDPIIHQATEKYILEHGRIEPLQPLYLGQYAVVAVLHLLTRIPFELIDRVLVPLLAVLSIPFVAMIGLKRGYGVPAQVIPLVMCLLFLIPFAEFTFTVPYHLSFLYALWFIFLFPLLKEKVYKIILGVFVLAALVTHPLLGVPLALLYLLGILFLKKPTSSWWLLGCCFLGVTFSIPVLFGIYRVLHGFSFWELIPLKDGIVFFLSLFIPPYTFGQSPFWWAMLYGAVLLIKLSILIIGCYSLWNYKDLWVKKSIIVFLCGLLGTLLLLALFVRIPGIRLNEQAEYMLRLRDTFFLFLAPFIILQLITIVKKYYSGFYKFFIIIFLAGMSAMMWYITYPQVNHVSHTAGWNVTSSDILAVQKIEKESQGKKYVVLSDPLFAIVALRERGFEKNITTSQFEKVYPYPISADHPLNQYWYKLLVGAFSSYDILAIKQQFGVEQVYVAVHNYQVGSLGIERSLNVNRAQQIYNTPFLSLYLLDSVSNRETILSK